MYYEWRTSLLYPDDLSDAEILKDSSRWQWWPLIVNEGACVVFRRSDAIRFGGFDEHPSFRGYFCGPYELAWRLVNAGWPEVWHDSSVALWHFAHPDPIGTNGQKASMFQLMEKAYPHMQGHALTSVEAFSTGRFQPLHENHEIWALRMNDRKIGSELEARYSNLTSQKGFSSRTILKLRISLILEIFNQYLNARLWNPARRAIRSSFGWLLPRYLQTIYETYLSIYFVRHTMPAERPILLCKFKGFNLVKYLDLFYAARHGLELDLTKEGDRCHPKLLIAASYYSLLQLVKVSRKES